MFHCKLHWSSDEYLVSRSVRRIFDSRSFKLNDEANLNIYDREFAREHVAIVEADIAKVAAGDARSLVAPSVAGKKLIEKAVPLSRDWQLHDAACRSRLLRAA